MKKTIASARLIEIMQYEGGSFLGTSIVGQSIESSFERLFAIIGMVISLRYSSSPLKKPIRKMG